MTQISHKQSSGGHGGPVPPGSVHDAIERFGTGLFSSILDALDDHVSVQDAEMRIVYANEATKKSFGKDIEGKLCYSVFAGRTEACTDCPVAMVISKGGSKVDTRRRLDINGNSAEVEIVATPLTDDNGVIVACVEVARDVSEHKRTRQKLLDKNLQLQKLTAISRDITAGLDLETILRKIVKYTIESTDADGGLVEILDRKSHQFNFSYTFNVDLDLSLLSFPARKGASGKVMRTGKPMTIDDYQEYPDAIEEIKAIGVRAILVVPLIAGNKFIGILAVGMLTPEKTFTEEDTELVAAISNQAAMAVENASLYEETCERIRILNELAMTAVSITSGLETGKILDEVAHHAAGVLGADAAMIALFDEDENRIVFPHAFNLPPELKTLSIVPGKGLVDTIIKTGKPVVINDYQSYQDRREGFVKAGVMAVATVPLTIGNRCIGAIGVMDTGSGQRFNEADINTLSVIADQAAVAVENARLYEKSNRSAEQLEKRVSERTEALSRLYEESERRGRELRQAYRRLRELDQLKSEFLASMSHELRTPLNAVIGFSRLILDGLEGEISDEQRQDIEIIHQNGNELLRLIDDLLELVSIEAGRSRADLEIQDPSEIATDAVMSLRQEADRKGLMLELGPMNGLNPVSMDRAKAHKVLMHLVDNAIKFTDRGRIDVAIVQNPEETVYSVKDTGKGLGRDEQEAIFNLFQKGPNSFIETDGVGLGLTLSQRYADFLHGRIWVESEKNQGSTFFFALPNNYHKKQDDPRGKRGLQPRDKADI